MHSLNKNEHSVPRDTQYYQDIKERKNAILMGDSLGDLHMSDGLSHEVVLKIGFISVVKNEDHARFKLFSEYFDVLLVNDESMSFPISLIKEIIKS